MFYFKWAGKLTLAIYFRLVEADLLRVRSGVCFFLVAFKGGRFSLLLSKLVTFFLFGRSIIKVMVLNDLSDFASTVTS